MTLLDKALEFSNKQAVTVTANATNDIDLGPIATGNAVRDVGAGEPIFLNYHVTTAFAGAGATLTLGLTTDDTSAFSTPVTVVATGAIPVASLVAGYNGSVAIPRGSEKFYRLVYTVAGGTFTAGNISSYITNSAQDTRTYISGTPIKAG